MKPRIDLSKTNRFTIWESGGLDMKRIPPLGTSIIVAGPDGEQLKIAFDTNPRENVTHCAFFAEIGQVLACCFLNHTQYTPDTGELNVSLELARIQALTTELVQGEAKAVAKLQTLWVHRESTDNKRLLGLADRYDPTVEGQRPEYQNLLRRALEKANVPLKEQRFFWAIPRPRLHEE